MTVTLKFGDISSSTLFVFFQNYFGHSRPYSCLFKIFSWKKLFKKLPSWDKSKDLASCCIPGAANGAWHRTGAQQRFSKARTRGERGAGTQSACGARPGRGIQKKAQKTAWLLCKAVWRCLQTLDVHLPHDPAIPSLGIDPEKWKCVHKNPVQKHSWKLYWC